MRPADQETTATEKAVCGPGSREECYTPPLRAPQGSPRAADGRGEHDHELSRRRLQEGMGEAGKQAGDQLELNTGEGSRVYLSGTRGKNGLSVRAPDRRWRVGPGLWAA